MITKFIDRENELNFLEKKYKEATAGFIVVYGRRRVGKTELIRQFFRNKLHIYFVASKTTISEQLSMFIICIMYFFFELKDCVFNSKEVYLIIV